MKIRIYLSNVLVDLLKTAITTSNDVAGGQSTHFKTEQEINICKHICTCRNKTNPIASVVLAGQTPLTLGTIDVVIWEKLMYSSGLL